jgi:hypothetical protein
MPIVFKLDFVSTGLTVRYRASEAPQLVRLDVSLEQPAFDSAVPVVVSSFVDAIGAGAAGGATFHPGAGRAKILSGIDIGDEGEEGPDYRYELEIAGMCPRFVRCIVDDMCAASGETQLRSMSLTGALAVDDGPLSVHESQVKAWVDDPAAYPEQWPRPGFPIVVKEVARGMSLRVAFADPLTDGVYDAVARCFRSWQYAVDSYVNIPGTQLGSMDRDAQYGRKKFEFLAATPDFDHARKPTRDALVNVLVKLHEQVARIAEVEIGMN